MTSDLRRALALICCLCLAACATGANFTYQDYLKRKGVTKATPDSFQHCHGYGCRLIDEDTLNTYDRTTLQTLFKSAQTPAAERIAIASSIAYLEQAVGQRMGTDTDIEGTYRQLGDDQLDCVDESVNTTIYLSLIQHMNLLNHHTIGIPSARTLFTTGRPGPHQTAVIIEKETNNKFAVDSWFHDNGARPEIVPMNKWLFGWRP